MALRQMLVNEEFDATIGNIVGADGQPTSLDTTTPPVWSSDAANVEIAAAPDGMSAIIRSTAELGAFTITVVGDGRHGEEVVELTGVLSGLVAPPDAVSFEITASDTRPRTDV